MNYVEKKNGEYDIRLLAHNATSGGYGNTWCLDICASNYMNENKSIIVELNESVKNNLAFGDNSKVSVNGRGNILFRAKDSSHQITFLVRVNSYKKAMIFT